MAVNFDGESRIVAVEICDVRAERVLAAESEAVELAAFQAGPEDAFRRCGFAAEPPGCSCCAGG